MKLFFATLFLSFSLFAQDTVLIDVREKDEIEQGMLKNATWIPLSQLNAQKVSQIRQDYKDKKIEVYCRSGGRAGKFIEQLGFPKAQAKNLGGYEELKAKGYSK